MKRKIFSVAVALLALVVLAAAFMAASTADCPHVHSQDLGEMETYAVNYGSFHIVYSRHSWHCFDCGKTYDISTPRSEPHTLPCSVCGGR